MRKILIVGVSNIVGGIETLFYGLFHKKSDAFDITFLSFDEECAFSDVYKSNGYKVDVIPSRRKTPFTFSKNVKNYFKAHNDFDYVWVNTASTSMFQFQKYAKKYNRGNK